ncbi:AMP-binding protein [Rhodopseudomonas sp. HC1]|uniref:AMP-binding protein n=1 Tax=Rhodopseudomonas infernalis TaxID=2897386 RepID=UPI001EE9630A|nr:AMP-binding protein [Rhodopseudomonas infernalis]MCG6205993.1 AMP-binding protein [Rhodopseudomonas infernalis]
MTNSLLDLPFADWALDKVIAGRVASTPDRPFLQFGNEPVLTFAQVHALALRFAAVLAKEGVGRGDRVAIFAGNSAEHIALWFAISLLGASDAPINPALRGRTLEHAINLVEPKLLVAEATLLPTLARDGLDLGTLRSVVWFGVPDQDLPALAGIELKQLGSSETEPLGADLPSLSPADTLSILFTSGTTGPAKGVIVTHAQAYLTARQTAEGLWVGADDVYYCAHPLFHMSPRFCVVYAALLTGARICFDRQFAADRWIDRIRESGATVTIGHGPLIEMIHQQPERPDDAQTRLTRLGTSPFPRHIAADFERRFGLKGIETWGMTEINIPCWHPHDEPLRPGAAGKIRHDWYEFQVVDSDTDLPLPTGEVGEFVVRPKLPWIVTPGYFRNPEATAKAYRNFWFHTGDSGYVDADGWVYFVDRLGDRIRRRAENISSYDIEVAANGHPAVLESAAVGVPSGYSSDDDIKLSVVPRPGQAVDPAELLSYLAAELPHHMVPRYIECLDALPRTPTQKVRKAGLRESGVTASTWDRKQNNVALRSLIAGVAVER